LGKSYRGVSYYRRPKYAKQSVVTRDRYMRSQMVRLNITKPFRTLDFQLIIKDFCKLWINGLGRMLYITVLYWT